MYQLHIVTLNGVQIGRYSNNGTASAKQQANEGSEIKSFQAPSLRQLRRKVLGRQDIPSRKNRRAIRRIASSAASYAALVNKHEGKSDVGRAPGAIHH